MKRYLRIAFSAVCGVVCLLLVALWVRSCWYVDRVLIHAPVQPVLAESFKGRFLVTKLRPSTSGKWRYFSDQSDAEYRNSVRWSFVADSDPLSNGMVIPYWPVAIAATVLGAAPWLRSRFSLRTLLIAMTLVAVVLGVIVYASR